MALALGAPERNKESIHQTSVKHSPSFYIKIALK